MTWPWRSGSRRPWQTAVMGAARATDSDEKSQCERVEDESKELARLWLRALGRRRSGYGEFCRRLELGRRRNTEREKERRPAASSFKGEDPNSKFASALSSSPRRRLVATRADGARRQPRRRTSVAKRQASCCCQFTVAD
jgi:hypothetical protein